MTTTLTTNFEIPIPPLDTVGTADGYGTLMQAADTAIKNAIGLGTWTDYSGASTIVGWSSFTTKILKYKKVGSLLFVSFNFNGTSDSASVTFTLPNAAVVDWRVPIWTLDNGATYDIGVLYMSAAAFSVTCKPTPSTGAVNWTPSGLKIAAGQFFYEVA